MAEVRADHARYCEEVWARVAEMAWAKGTRAGLGSGIKSLAERLNGGCGMVTT